MSRKLYLIRVDMERILGPMTLEEMKDLHAKMKFGIQDEVCSSLNKWVHFDNSRMIKKYYPELLSFVEANMLAEWGVSQFGDEQDTVRFSSPLTSQASKNSGLFQMVAFFIVGITLVGGAYLLKGNRWKQLAGQVTSPLFSEAQQLYSDSYYAEFEAFMDSNKAQINKQMSTKVGFKRWIPLVRTVAFKRDGKWDGLTTSSLRGRQVHGMPADCSKEAWTERWKESYLKWGEFLEGDYLPNSEWARILLLDPKLVQKIGKARGWIEPENYYEACVEMAALGLSEAEIEESYNWEKEIILARLLWLQDFWGAKKTDSTYLMSGSLWTVACYEGAKDKKALNECEVSITPSESWEMYLDESKLINQAYLALADKTKTISEDERKELLSKLPKKSRFTGLSYGKLRRQIKKMTGR